MELDKTGTGDDQESYQDTEYFIKIYFKIEGKKSKVQKSSYNLL